jgi:hypothetical protein
MVLSGIGCSERGATGAGMVCNDGAVAAAPGSVVMGIGAMFPYAAVGSHTAGAVQAEGLVAVG